MPIHKLNYASGLPPRKAFRCKWAPGAALAVGCAALLADALSTIGILRGHSISPLTMLPAMFLPFIGIVFAALGRPNESSRAALGLAASGVGLVAGGVLFICYCVANMPNI
jgi:tellurite resistance protein TehA-like permease